MRVGARVPPAMVQGSHATLQPGARVPAMVQGGLHTSLQLGGPLPSHRSSGRGVGRGREDAGCRPEHKDLPQEGTTHPAFVFSWSRTRSSAVAPACRGPRGAGRRAPRPPHAPQRHRTQGAKTTALGDSAAPSLQTRVGCGADQLRTTEDPCPSAIVLLAPKPGAKLLRRCPVAAFVPVPKLTVSLCCLRPYANGLSLGPKVPRGVHGAPHGHEAHDRAAAPSCAARPTGHLSVQAA